MLKKLASLLFEEEEEVIEEELDIKEKPVKEKTLKDKPIYNERSLISSMNPKPNEVKEEIILEEEPEEIEHKAVEDIIKPTKPEFGIAFGEPVVLKEKSRVLKDKPIYEFRPVISPMFGVSESKKNQPIRQVVNPPQSLKRSRINTVISPIYGDIENKKEPVHANPTKAYEPVFKHDPYIEDTKPDLPKFKSENYSLDDLLSPIKPEDESAPIHESFKEEEDDELAHQFSLFDDMK